MENDSKRVQHEKDSRAIGHIEQKGKSSQQQDHSTALKNYMNGSQVQEEAVEVEQEQEEKEQSDGWVRDHNDYNKVIYHDTEAEAETRCNYLESLNKWEHHRVHQYNGKYVVETRGKRTVANFIDLIKRVEAAYPNRSADDILASLRTMFANSNRWQEMMNKKGKKLPKIEPVEGKLTKEDLEQIKQMIVHGEDEKGNEKGIVKDSLGNYVAMGHVLTGTEAGMNHLPNVKMLPINFPTSIDNLYGTTISGDLGQSATVLNNKQPESFIGEGTEATEAEMIGDIDGFNIGKEQLSKDKDDTVKLSDLLQMYYEKIYLEENKQRYLTFESNAQVKEEEFEQQVLNFLNTYNYKNNAKVSFTLGMSMRGGGMTPGSINALLDQRADGEAKQAVQQFRTWLSGQQKDTTNNAIAPNPDSIRITSSGEWVYVVSDPNQWKSGADGRSAYKINKPIIIDTITAGPPVYPEGVQAVVLDEGSNEMFNEVVDTKYRWVKVHVTEGASEGTTGWVSNLFVERAK